MTGRKNPTSADLWVDEIAVERAISGNPVGRPLTRAEMEIAIDALRGLPYAEIGRRIGTSPQNIKYTLHRLANEPSLLERQRLAESDLVEQMA